MPEDEPAAPAEVVAAPGADVDQRFASHNSLELIVADPWICSVALGILIHDMWSAILGRVRRRKEIAKLESWLALPS